MSMLILLQAACLLFTPAMTHNPMWQAMPDGAHVVPPTASTGTAIVDWGWSEESESTAMYIVYEALSDSVTGAFVATGGDSENGPVLRVIATSYFPSGSDFTFEYRQEDEDALRGETAYVVITTKAFPEGEVRGRFYDNHAPATLNASWGTIRAAYR